MAWRGSLSRSLISTARASIRSSPPLPRRLRPPSVAAPRLQPRRFSFPNPREEWKRWVMRDALNHQKQDNDATLYLNSLLDQHKKCYKYLGP